MAEVDLGTVVYRLDAAERDVARHEQWHAEFREGLGGVRQELALLRASHESEREAQRQREKARNEREDARDARVKRLTAACVSVAITVTAGSIGTILTFILTRGTA